MFPCFYFEGDEDAQVVTAARVSSRPKRPGVSPCTSGPCYPGARCFESVHVSAGFVCGPCPPGLHGNGQTCTSAGESEAICAPCKRNMDNMDVTVIFSGYSKVI